MRIKRAALQLSIYFVAILSCLSRNVLAQGLTEPVTVSRVGPEGGRVRSIVVDPSDSNTVYAASDTGVFKSTDRGTTWSYRGLMGAYVLTIAITSQSPATVYAAAPGNIFKSLDAGATWNQVSGTPPNLILLGIDSHGTLFGRIRPTGGLFKSSDGGTTWQPAGAGIPIGTALGALAIDPGNANTLYVTGFPTLTSPLVTVFKSTNGGASWSPIASGMSATLSGFTIDPGNTSTLYITTPTGFLKSTDGGKNWHSINNGLTECFCTRGPLVIDPENTTTLYAVRFDGIIFKSINGGQSWRMLNGSFQADSLTVDPRQSNTFYASTFFGAFKTTDGGVSWSAINTDLRAVPVLSAAVDPQSPGILYAGGYFGVFKSTDKGKTWAASNSGIKLQYPADAVVALAIDPQTPDTLYAGTGEDECGYGAGGVFKSVDAGMNWIDTGLVSCIAALAIDPQTPSTIFAGTWYKGVIKSTDGGATWTESNSGLPDSYVATLALDTQNPRILYAGVLVTRDSRSTLFKSTDGGTTWNSTALIADRALILAVTVDRQNPGNVYAVVRPFGSIYNNSGDVWKSADGGTSWEDLSSGLPSPVYAVGVDPKKPTTIYVGTDLGVITSMNGGESWTLLTSATGSTQLVEIGPDGTLFAGGSGGLFAISPDSPPTVTAVTFDVNVVRAASSYTATFMGSNLNDNTYFDVQVRVPGNDEDIVVLNWQVGTSESHFVPAGVLSGTWTIDGARAHQDAENHAGSFARVSALITVSP